MKYKAEDLHRVSRQWEVLPQEPRERSLNHFPSGFRLMSVGCLVVTASSRKRFLPPKISAFFRLCKDTMTKLSGAVDPAGGREAIQRDPDRLGKWFTDFNKGKCTVLPLGRNNQRYQSMHRAPSWKATAEKAMQQQCSPKHTWR